MTKSQKKTAGMMFHQAVVLDDQLSRQDIFELTPETRETHLAFDGRIRPHVDLTYDFGMTAVRGTVLHYSHYGGLITHLDMPGMVGATCLYLTGQMSSIDQKFCRLFQMRCAGLSWRLPVPPLELTPRPLFFYVLFSHDDSLGPATATELVQRANGIGLAFLNRSQL